MEDEYVTTIIRLFSAVAAGAVIGLERTYHGRPAGFRTHALVCTASGLLMLLTVFSKDLIASAPVETIRMDPTRMAQGIMTGIGFLGAGVILKEGATIRGLTTAASVWMTASIGIMIGVGLWFAALVALGVTVGALAGFRWIETKIPSLEYSRLTIRLTRDAHLSQEELSRIITSHDITCSDPGYRLEDRVFQYEVTIRTRNAVNFSRLTETLGDTEHVDEFSIVPTVG